MTGKLIDKLGRLIAATAGVSFMAALGERVESGGTRTYLNQSGQVYAVDQIYNKNALDYAGASAMVDASNRLGQILLDRYEKLVPVVEVLPGREVVAVFSTTSEIEMVEEEEDEDTVPKTTVAQVSQRGTTQTAPAAAAPGTPAGAAAGWSN